MLIYELYAAYLPTLHTWKADLDARPASTKAPRPAYRAAPVEDRPTARRLIGPRGARLRAVCTRGNANGRAVRPRRALKAVGNVRAANRRLVRPGPAQVAMRRANSGLVCSRWTRNVRSRLAQAVVSSRADHRRH